MLKSQSSKTAKIKKMLNYNHETHALSYTFICHLTDLNVIVHVFRDYNLVIFF